MSSPPSATSTRAAPLRRRLAAWYVVVIALLLGHLVWFWLLRGPRILDRDPVLITGQFVLGALVLAMAALLKTSPADALRLPRRRSERLILGGAALLQAAAIVLLLPGLSEDVVRYRVDGRMWFGGTSPYATTPDEWIGRDGSPADDVDRMVAHRDVHSIYPPVAQALFAVAAAVDATLAPLPPGAIELAHPGEMSPWRRHVAALAWRHRGTASRVLYASFGLGCTFVLLRLLRDADRSAWWATLFAWNPLVVLETGGMGHQEAAGAFFLLVAVRAAWRGRGWLAGAMLALAVGVKPQAVVILPFLWRDAAGHGSTRAGLAVPLAFAAIVAGLFVPALAYQGGYVGFSATGVHLSDAWEFNGSIYELWKWAFGAGDYGMAMEHAKTGARRLAAIATIATAALLWWRRATAAEAGYWLMLVILLVSPVAYPWYLVWVVCLVPLLPAGGWAALAWSATAAASYVVWHEPTWVVPRAAALLEYGPVYAALLADIVLRARSGRGLGRDSMSGSIRSV